jgi:hypothetical protein
MRMVISIGLIFLVLLFIPEFNQIPRIYPFMILLYGAGILTGVIGHSFYQARRIYKLYHMHRRQLYKTKLHTGNGDNPNREDNE